MAEEAFRLPKSSYDELVKIIQAYGNSRQEASLDEIAKTAVMDKTIISRNSAFLTSVGLIQGGKAKGVTEKGKQLSLALQHNVAEDIALHWRDIVTSTEFLQKMVTAVSIRGGMEDAALRSHIAYSAGEPKGPHAMAGAGAVVEILKTSGLVKEQDGKLVAESSAMQNASSVSIRRTLKEPERASPSTAEPVAATPQVSIPSVIGVPGISIQIQIQCTAAEISDLGPKLRTLLKQLKEDTKVEGQ